MNICICCSSRLLRHVNCQKTYWFCPTCHQEMPNIADLAAKKIKIKLDSPKKIVKSP